MYVHNKRYFKDREYKDRYGMVLHKGDLCIECSGENHKKEWSYELYEVPGLDPFDGSGVIYFQNGEPSTFKWVNLSRSCKLNPTMLGDDIMFTFYHGAYQFSSPIKFDDEHDNSLDIIKASDYWIISYAKVSGLDITKDVVPCPRCGNIPSLSGWYDEHYDKDCYAAVCECGAVYQVSTVFGIKHRSNPESLRRSCLFGWNRLAAGVRIPDSWKDSNPTTSGTKPIQQACDDWNRRV